VEAGFLTTKHTKHTKGFGPVELEEALGAAWDEVIPVSRRNLKTDSGMLGAFIRELWGLAGGDLGPRFDQFALAVGDHDGGVFGADRFDFE
jgi:hypothetical protein